MFRISRRVGAAAVVALLMAGVVVLGFAAASDGDLDPFGHHGGEADVDGAGHDDDAGDDGDDGDDGHDDDDDDDDGGEHAAGDDDESHGGDDD